MKPVIIYSLPDAIKEIASLKSKQAELEKALAQERSVYGRVTYELTTKNESLNQQVEEKDKELTAKDHLIATLQEELARISEQMEEGLRKGWQLDQLRDILFGKRSEKFIPSPCDTQTAIQQTLGADFDSEVVAAIVQEQTVHQSSPEGPTNRNQKRCLW